MSVRFDAATDKISYTGGGVPDPAAGFTILGWVYNAVDLNTNATWARLFAGSTTATFATDVDGTSGPGYFTGGGTITATTGTPVGAWRAVAATCLGTAGKMYAAPPGGPTEVVSGTVSGAASPTGVTFGGRSPSDDSEWWSGRCGYFRVYAGVLTQAEIEAEWQAVAAVRTADLWADWPLEIHTDLTDHSGNGHDLAAGSTPTTTEAGPPLAESHSGAVTLAASAALAVPGHKVTGGTVTLSATAALAPQGTKTTAGGAELVVSAGLIAGGSRAASGGVTLGASVGLSVDGSRGAAGGAALVTSAALHVSGSSVRSGAVTLRASTALHVGPAGAAPPDTDVTATLAPQPQRATLGGRRWTATLEEQ